VATGQLAAGLVFGLALGQKAGSQGRRRGKGQDRIREAKEE